MDSSFEQNIGLFYARGSIRVKAYCLCLLIFILICYNQSKSSRGGLTVPDIITHYSFGCRLLEKLSPEQCGQMHRGLYDLALLGPDPWFAYRFCRPKHQEGKVARAGHMHRVKTGAFLTALCERAVNSTAKDMMFSYLAGFLCHYVLDSTVHPYIICRSGSYDGTPETIACRGDHTRLERAIDWRYIKKDGLPRHPARKKVLYMRHLPDEIRADLDAVYESVYGWQDVSKDLDICIFYQRLFYLLAEDGTGLVDKVIKKIDNGYGHNDMTAMTYYRKDRPDLDVLNENHTLWHHPRDLSVTSSASFDEMFEQGLSRAEELVRLAYDCVYNGRAIEKDMFGDLSYETGFDLSDSRNNNRPQCEPLRFK